MIVVPPRLLLAAYAQGIFPMAHAELGGEIRWYAPDPRAILPLDEFRVSRRLRQTARKAPFEIRVSTDFEGVMRACSEPAPGREGSWISEGLIASYAALHRAGFAHSVEAWRGDELVGGLYGVALGGLFAGESMFHRASDASKLCLIHLVERMRARGYALLDIQFMTDHLRRFGAVEIPRAEYEARLERAVHLECSFVGPPSAAT